ncbi:3-deoxy-7-phosphoheptulonate synthase [Streptomyces sp. URMC 126]|uniref:3-deoxy-7-phosphoheptulonate synthase n=1 Tax=Streptomyces sp. URMC 126 TaxID=3423401 RepID=UPI003F1A8A39
MIKNDVLADIRTRDALQQPAWGDLLQVNRVRDALAARPPLVRAADVTTLRGFLAHVAAGRALIVQAGDCAEDPQECTAAHVARKAALLDLLAGALRLAAHKPVIRVGRIAGQFAKPRSRPTEIVDGVELPVFRGHMVNGPEADADSRWPDPLRILTGHMAAGDIMEHLGWRERAAGRDVIEPVVWTSHEALLLDYEVPMLRTDDQGRLYLGSTHFPWIGERTRQVEGAHVALLAEVSNPVACKVGPAMTPGELLALCERLDPYREPGRLTLIARMGADNVTERLPALVGAVRGAGHPVIWLTDPMHGNTVSAPGGRKTRLVPTVTREVARFLEAVTDAGGTAGGLHLETTPDDVTECAADESGLAGVGERYTSCCDPRLNPWQAVSVVSSWTAA